MALAIVLLVLWIFALITAHFFGGFIHLLLAVAIILVYCQPLRWIQRFRRRYVKIIKKSIVISILLKGSFFELSSAILNIKYKTKNKHRCLSFFIYFNLFSTSLSLAADRCRSFFSSLRISKSISCKTPLAPITKGILRETPLMPNLPFI